MFKSFDLPMYLGFEAPHFCILNCQCLLVHVRHVFYSYAHDLPTILETTKDTLFMCPCKNVM